MLLLSLFDLCCILGSRGSRQRRSPRPEASPSQEEGWAGEPPPRRGARSGAAGVHHPLPKGELEYSVDAAASSLMRIVGLRAFVRLCRFLLYRETGRRSKTARQSLHCLHQLSCNGYGLGSLHGSNAASAGLASVSCLRGWWSWWWLRVLLLGARGRKLNKCTTHQCKGPRTSVRTLADVPAGAAGAAASAACGGGGGTQQ